MALSFYWSRRAANKFEKIIDYLEEHWGEKSTKNFVTKTYSILEMILIYPEIGALQNVQRNIRGFVITEHVTLFYQIQDNKIILLNFFSNLQHPKKKF